MTESARAHRDWPTILGLAVIGVVAVVWSFTALSDLARKLGIVQVIPIHVHGVAVGLHVAWGLPLTVDTLAAVATRVWLQGRVGAEAVRYARRVAWSAIGATVVGNAYYGWLTGDGRFDSVLASAVPAVAVGGIVHLSVLMGRKPGDEPAARVGRTWVWVRAFRWAKAWLAGRKARAARAVLLRAKPVETGRAEARPAVPTGADSNEVIAADLRRFNAARRADGLDPLGRDAVAKRYAPMGSTRADTVRDMAARPEPTAGPRLVRDEEAAG